MLDYLLTIFHHSLNLLSKLNEMPHCNGFLNENTKRIKCTLFEPTTAVLLRMKTIKYPSTEPILDLELIFSRQCSAICSASYSETETTRADIMTCLLHFHHKCIYQ